MPRVDRLDVSAFTVPTESPEADGTIEWNETTLVLVSIRGGGLTGIGYSFADTATATVIDAHLKRHVIGGNCFDIAELWSAMVRAIRNLGRAGICSMAISAVDNALWDLKAKVAREVSVADLLGRAHTDDPLRVRRPVAGMRARDVVDRVDHVFGRGHAATL